MNNQRITVIHITKESLKEAAFIEGFRKGFEQALADMNAQNKPPHSPQSVLK